MIYLFPCLCHWACHTHWALLALPSSLWTQRAAWPCCTSWKQALRLRALLQLAHACVPLFLPPQHLSPPPSSAPLPTCQSCTVAYSEAGIECFYPSICHMQRSSKRGLLIPLCLSAAAAAKSLQSCLNLCDPMDGSPPGSPVPGILQARTLEWVAISFSNA